MTNDKNRFDAIAASVRSALRRGGLEIIKSSRQEADYEGWWIDLARWPNFVESTVSRPNIQMFLDRTLGDGDPVLWVGFASHKAPTIDSLIQQATPLLTKYARFDQSDDVSLSLVRKNDGLAREHSDAYYFGRYEIDATARTDDALAKRAADFILSVVHLVDPLIAERADVNEIENDPDVRNTERQALILARRGQGKFRADLITHWQGCAVSGSTTAAILRASHIRPWRDCSNIERLDSQNGLLLSANLDALFDQGLITFSNDGKVEISPLIANEERKRLGLHGDMRLRITPSKRQARYLQQHRAITFKAAL